MNTKIALNASIEDCIYFNILSDESLQELWLKIGFSQQYDVRVKLG